MAKTKDSERIEAGAQTRPEPWSPDSLMRALVRGTMDEKVEVLRRSGIMDERGKLSKAYKNWGGDRITRAGNYEPGHGEMKRKLK